MFFHKILFINNKQSRLNYDVFLSIKVKKNFLANRCWVKRFLFFLYMCWRHPILRPIKTDMLLINNSLDEASSFFCFDIDKALVISQYMHMYNIFELSITRKRKIMWCVLLIISFLLREKRRRRRRRRRQYILFSFSMHSIICNNLYQ